MLSRVGPLAREAKGQQADRPGVTTITHITPALKLLEADINKKPTEDFPGGAVVKNLPANAGDMGSSPGPGRSHMPWSN